MRKPERQQRQQQQQQQEQEQEKRLLRPTDERTEEPRSTPHAGEVGEGRSEVGWRGLAWAGVGVRGWCVLWDSIVYTERERELYCLAWPGPCFLFPSALPPLVRAVVVVVVRI